MQRKSLELTIEQWAALDVIAAELSLTPGIGPTPKRPSWRILIREIANHNLVVTKGTDNDCSHSHVESE